MNVRLGAFLVGADHDTVEIRRESERVQLVFGKAALGVGEQVDVLAFGFERVEQIGHAVIEPKLFGGKAAERFRDKGDQRLGGLHALLGEHRAEHLFYFNVDHGVFRMTAANGGFFLVHQSAVGALDLLIGIVGAVVVVEKLHFFPQLRLPFVRADVDEGAV